MTKTINDVPINIILETIARLETEAEVYNQEGAELYAQEDFDTLLLSVPIFIRGPIEQIMSQPGYPDNIDWDAVIEDGGISLIPGN